jgi:hypothetical protein
MRRGFVASRKNPCEAMGGVRLLPSGGSGDEADDE